ncbi:MAG: carboxynorspermidine decarboxylase [Prevotellaceae bacterium]|nr:carboxynorspermidine decarboxylase [Candidatus Colivivens equi]MCQ2077686.1 carboxynorspermidine decarboxylase [Bacteroidaceae bacterium]
MHTPYFLIDKAHIEHNLKVLRKVMDDTGCKILLAQKCFSCYGVYPLVSQYLSGATSSGLFEARLCHEEMPDRENHIFSPAFREEDIEEICQICDHIVFNTPVQLLRFGQKAKDAGLEVGLRINPECSTQVGHSIYDPCAPGSRLGTTLKVFEESIGNNPSLLSLIDGLHFHTLCEQNSDDLKTTLDAVVARFGKYLHHMKWINFGGGHHITRSDYDISLLESCIIEMRDKYSLQVYLEPGEAIALNAGYLCASILEIQPADEQGISNVILDTSAACHMPDVIEMPYTPPLQHSRIISSDELHNPTNSNYIYRLGGPTCLSGDIIGLYQFDHELCVGEEILFEDMAIYSMVKTNTFNGMPLPDIYIKDSSHDIHLWKSFTYHDFKHRI